MEVHLWKDYSWDEWINIQDRRVQIAAVVCAGVSIYYVYRRLTRKRYRMPPGPVPLPLVGNLLGSGLTNLHLRYQEYSKKYGPVFTFHFGPSKVVILNSAKVMKEAFVTKGADFGGRPISFMSDLVSGGRRNISMTDYGPVWKVQRKIAHMALRKYTSGEKINVLLKNSFEIVTKEIDKELMKGPLSVAEWNMTYIHNVFSTLCFGRLFQIDDPFCVELKNGFQSFPQYATVLAIVDAFPFLLKFYEFKAIKHVKQVIKEMMYMLEIEYKNHEETFDQANLTDFMYDLIDLRKKAESDTETSQVMKEMTLRHFLMICSDIFFAGTDTTKVTMTFIMQYAAKYPEMQRKIHDEIDDVIGENVNFSLKTKDELHYLHAFLYEVMRISPASYVGVPHRTMCDTTIGEYDIPKDTMIIANQWGIQHDESIMPDHDQFRPERWLRENGTFDHQSCPFVPFSMGTRNCVGEALAKVEILMSVALFFQKYAFKVPDGVEMDMEPVESLFILEPKPFKLELTKRC